MYASLIGAGVSQLYDLLRSQTQSTDNLIPTAGKTPTAASPSTTTTSGTGRVGGLSSDLNTLLLGLQSGGSAPASSTASLLAYARGHGSTASQSASTSLTA